MLNLNKLPILNNNHEYLIDNDDYHTLIDQPENYLIVYSYNSDFLDTIVELISFNIEFAHCACHLSDESYLLIDITQG